MSLIDSFGIGPGFCSAEPCFCIGAQNGAPACPCQMRATLVAAFPPIYSDPQKSGFFDLPKQQTCRHPGHEVPAYLHIPEGKGYRHVCPGCGFAKLLLNHGVSL